MNRHDYGNEKESYRALRLAHPADEIYPSRDDVQQRALTGAARAQQPEDLTPLTGPGDAVQESSPALATFPAAGNL